MADLLNIGKSGLNVAKKSLETTGHNISNANTEGYSRQKVVQTSNIPVAKDGLIEGTGARIVGINRIHDKFIEKRLNQSYTDHSYFKERNDQLSQVENIFNESESDGVNKIMNKFFNAFRELANQPENETIRSVVRDNADLVIKDFNRMSERLDGLSKSIDKRLVNEVFDINQTIKSVSHLNKKIAAMESLGDETGDLRDQRDLLVSELSKSFDVHTYLDNRNNYIVNAKGVGTLVSGGSFQKLAIGKRPMSESSNGMDGAAEIFFEGKSGQPITKKFAGGRISSMLKVRNEDIKNMRDNVDSLAFNFANSVNAVHRRGFVNREIKVDQLGQPVKSDSQGPTTGIDFFEVPITIRNAAENLKLNKLIAKDLSNIATALNPNSPGDNRVAIGISKLQHEKVMEGGKATFEETYLGHVGNIGIETGKAKLDEEQYNGLLAQAKNLRERISGVNLDEETSNMIRYQHAYQAAAKVMETADEMFKTVLAIKR